MHNRIAHVLRQRRPLGLDLVQLAPMTPLKHAIARDVKPLPLHILPNALEDLAIPHAHTLEQPDEAVLAVGAIGAPVVLAGAGEGLGEEFLARVGRVTSAAAVRVAADVAVGVPDIVAVFLVEGVVGDELEAVAPEEEAFVEAEPDALEEEGVLEAGEVFEVVVPAELDVEVAHAEGEMGCEGVDGAGRDGSRHRVVAVEGGIRAVCGARRGEVLGEVFEDGGEPVVLVQPGQRACGLFEGGV